jgi:hypothetical protein
VTTLSVRDIAARHLDRTGDLSITTDVFGYRYRDDSGRVFGALDGVDDVLPGDGSAEQPTRRSLKQLLEMVSGPSVDVVVFLVDHEPDFTGAVTPAQAAKTQFALQVARDIWAQRGFGIRRVEWGYLTPEQAGGRTHITSIFEAVALTIDFSGRPGAMDLFIVQTMGALAGRSPKNGPCNKDILLGMTGCVLELAGTARFTGIGIAHEFGHYLGLGHESNEENVMHGPTAIFGKCDTGPQMVQLTSAQAAEMKEHCMVLQV